MSALARWRDETGDTTALGFARMSIGGFLVYEGARAWQELSASTYFGDVFHMAMIPERLVPSRSVYAAILGLQIALGAIVLLGRFARPALFVAAFLGVYVLLCDRVQFHHNRYSLACFAFLLAFAPCDRAYVVGPARDRTGPLWAMRLAQLQMSIIYLASSSSKLLDPDWRGGAVLAVRFAMNRAEAVARGVPAGLYDALSNPGAASVLAKLAIATEIFLAVGLWLPRARAFALWWGLMFHLTIEATSKVEIFTWLSLTVYVLFATPDRHARTLAGDPKSAVVRVVHSLDWLHRFALETAPTLAVVERDGSRRTGFGAVVAITRATPLFFPLWLPLAFITRGAALVRGQRSAQTRSRASDA
jgi:Vitamin K-dependent gamma-carboxylase